MIGNKGTDKAATESQCLLRTGGSPLLNKSPMNSSSKNAVLFLYELGRGATWALTGNRLKDVK